MTFLDNLSTHDLFETFDILKQIYEGRVHFYLVQRRFKLEVVGVR